MAVSGEPSNDVFISYRREAGGILAMALHQHLSEHGLDAFYDIESLRAGQFDTVILNQIAARPYFLLVLTPGTLDRCREPADWLRREIEQALGTRRVIVPVHTPNFDFGDIERLLPESVAADLQRFNGQELPQRWFKYAVQQLVEEFLLPIELESAAAPAADRAVVDRLREQAQAAIAVTESQLSAQEYFERAHARGDDDLDGKIADYTEAIRLDPGYAIAFNNRGVARRDNGDLEGALADYDEAIRLDPEYAFAYNNRGIARRDTGDLEGGLADYDEAIRLDPGYAAPFNNRGVARRQDSDDLEGAVADYDEAIRLDPEYARAHYNRGNAHLALQDLDAALADYDAAIRLDPENANAFHNRALVKRDQGDLEGAIADAERGAALAPGDGDFHVLLEQLRQSA